MPNRFEQRTPLNVGVELRHRGKKLGFYRTRDIDRRAAFIEAVATGLAPHDVVEVDFIMGNSGLCRSRRKGVVVRNVSEGVAVSFENEDAAPFQTVGELLLQGAMAAQRAAGAKPVRAGPR